MGSSIPKLYLSLRRSRYKEKAVILDEGLCILSVQSNRPSI